MYSIEIKKTSRFKQFFKKIGYRLEEGVFNLLLRVPEKLLPRPVLKWATNYLEKRNQKLKTQATQIKFKNAYLEKAARELNTKC